MTFSTTVRALKNAALPSGKQYRRLPLGLAAGCVVGIDFHHQMGIYLGIYEREIKPYLRALLRPGYSCFDVGGLGGYEALAMAKRTGGKVVSFECEAVAAEEMRETFAKNPYPILTVEAFVGRTDDATHVTLDTASRKYFVPDVLKIDIEGAEVDALTGAGRLLAERRPHLIVEVHGKDQEDGCLEILTGHGYVPEVVNQRGFFREQRPLDHNRWLICRGRD